MLRGTIMFKCDNCKKEFKGLDIEYSCTCFQIRKDVHIVEVSIQCQVEVRSIPDPYMKLFGKKWMKVVKMT